MGLLMLLTAFPLNQLLLGKVMGIADDLRLYIVWPLAACAVFPFFYGAANLLRGFFAGAHRTALVITSYSIHYTKLYEPLTPGQKLTMTIRRTDGLEQTLTVVCRLDTLIEVDYYRNGGILNYVLRRLARG